MPIFEFLCNQCDRRFEVIVRGGEKPACPSCGSRRLEKRLSVFAVGNGGSAGASGRAAEAWGGAGGGCGTCGDPRGPGSCGLDN